MSPARVLLGAVLLCLAGCGGRGEAPTAERPPGPSAAADVVGGRAVLERARAAHGSARLDNATVTFGFRGDRFTAERDGGRFRYERARTDSAGAVTRDVLSNEGLARTVDGAPAEIPPDERGGVETAVNSVVYFALLPHALADPAVRPRRLGRDTVRGEPYDLIEVTFEEEGGGADWEDRFLYWVHADRATVDYLAYRYHTGDGGTRFRAATNFHTVGGVRSADHRNLTADSAGVFPRLEDYPRLFEAGRLRHVSDIVLDDVRVSARASG